jgi:hypothetical protein
MIEANGLNIRVQEFLTRLEPVKDDTGRATGAVVPVDYVVYGPPDRMNRQAIEARVNRVLKARKPVDGSKNTAEFIAWARAEFIRPHYEAWKRGEELPDDGMPISACNFLRPEDVVILKQSGVRSVQELASLSESVIDRVQIPAMREKRTQAKRFLEAQDINKAAAEMAKRDDKIAELERMIAAMGKPADPEVDGNGDRIPTRRRLSIPQPATENA